MQKRLGRKPGRPRNPRLEQMFRPSDQDRRCVQLLAGFAIPLDRICWAVINKRTRRPISKETLQKYFENELKLGRAEVDQLLADGLSKRLREANPTILIWCSKNLWHWRDVVEQQGNNASVDVTIALEGKALADALREHGLPPTIFGRDAPTIDEQRLLEGNGLAHDDGDEGGDG
jgi:hypothetical protein